MSALLDSFREAFGESLATARTSMCGLSNELLPARQAALDALLADGLPGPREEAWKYTSLRALERRAFAPADAVAPAFDPALLAGIPAPRLVFTNGRFDPGQSDLSGLPAGASVEALSQFLASGEPRDANFLARRYERRDEVFARANAALAADGAVVRIDAGVRVEAPLHLVFVGVPQAGDRAWHLRHFIDLRNDAALDIVEHQLAAGDHAHLANEVLHLHAGQRAGAPRPGAARRRPRHPLRPHRRGAGARCPVPALRPELGTALSRHELNVRLEGDGARLTANGVLLGDGRRHVDTRLGIEHIGRDTACELLWRGIADGRSKVVFHGGIGIRAGADGTDAALSNKNLLLSAEAEIDTQPVLVIDADEVKAAHGATVGQLDATAMFYLRSRGLPGAQARRLLTVAFCREPLLALGDEAGDDGLRQVLLARLDAALAAALGAGDGA